MDNFDEKMHEGLKLRPLQTECLIYRQEIQQYRTYVKRACELELKNLINVEMVIEEPNLKIPDERQLPPLPKEIHGAGIGSLLEECRLVKEGMKLL